MSCAQQTNSWDRLVCCSEAIRMEFLSERKKSMFSVSWFAYTWQYLRCFVRTDSLTVPHSIAKNHTSIVTIEIEIYKRSTKLLLVLTRAFVYVESVACLLLQHPCKGYSNNTSSWQYQMKWNGAALRWDASACAYVSHCCVCFLSGSSVHDDDDDDVVFDKFEWFTFVFAGCAQFTRHVLYTLLPNAYTILYSKLYRSDLRLKPKFV